MVLLRFDLLFPPALSYIIIMSLFFFFREKHGFAVPPIHALIG